MHATNILGIDLDHATDTSVHVSSALIRDGPNGLMHCSLNY